MIQQYLDKFFYSRKWVASSLAYLSIRLFGIEATFEDVQRGKYSLRHYETLTLDRAQSLDELLEIAQECHKTAEVRRLQVAEKCKTLLTVSSLSVALIGFLLPQSLSWEAWWMKALFFAAIAALINTIFLLLVLFDVGSDEYIDLSQENVGLSEADLKKSLINQRLKCASSLDDRTDYQVNIYGAARFFFLSGFFIVAVLFSIGVLNQNASAQTSNLIKALRSDDNLIGLLRGPQGARGNPGKSIDVGDLVRRLQSDPVIVERLRGSKGEKGERGEAAPPIDEKDIVDRVFKDPRMNPSASPPPTP